MFMFLWVCLWSRRIEIKLVKRLIRVILSIRGLFIGFGFLKCL